MSDISRYLKYLITLVLLTVVIYAYFWLKGFDYSRTNPVIAIAEDNLFFVETRNPISFIDEITGNDIWSGMLDIPEWAEMNSFIKNFGNLEFSDERIQELFNNKAYFVVNGGHGDDPSVNFILQQSRKIRESQLISALNATGKVDSIIKVKFQGSVIYHAIFLETMGLKDLYFTSSNGLIIAGFSSTRVEETLSTMKERETAKPIHAYDKLKMTTSGNVIGNLYFQNSSLDKLLNGYLSEPASKLNVFAKSAGFDLSTGKDYIELNGFLSTLDDENNALDIISGQVPVASSIQNAIPASAVMFFHLSFNDISGFFRKQSGFSPWKHDHERLESIKNKYNIDLRPFFETNTAGEFGMAIINHRQEAARFFILELNSGSIAESQLVEWHSQWLRANNKNAQDYSHQRRIDNLQGINIYHLPLGGIPGMVFGDLFKSIGGDYFTIYQNYIVFGNSSEAIGEYIYQLMLGRNLPGTDRYKNIQEKLLSRSAFFLYSEPYNLLALSTGRLSAKTKNLLNDYPGAFEKLSTMTIQVNPADELLYSRIFLNYAESSSEYVNTVWMSRLDSINIMKPAIVLNHHTGGREIMVQDALHQLYLISSAGTIIWKVPLGEKILSDIHQIDYYRNGRLQYLFNTKSRIYLIDRNGNAVDKYPISLRSPATNGIALFDYENDGNIRICIASENKLIYMYDREGRTVPGWNPSPTDHQVEKPLQHFRVNRRDFIVASDKYKTYIYDRQGRIRVNPDKQHPLSANNTFSQDLTQGTNNARLVTTDPGGNILYFYLSGKTEIMESPALDPKHFFLLSDLNGNNQFERIFVSDKTLSVARTDGSEVFKYNFDAEINHPPFIYEFASNDRKIGIISENEGKIYLFNNDGSVYKGFPLKGSTLFSISGFPGLNARFNLIVGNVDNFLYNYSVH